MDTGDSPFVTLTDCTETLSLSTAYGANISQSAGVLIPANASQTYWKTGRFSGGRRYGPCTGEVLREGWGVMRSEVIDVEVIFCSAGSDTVDALSDGAADSSKASRSGMFSPEGK